MDHALHGHKSKWLPNADIEHLRVGEDVAITGLFVHYSGIARNIPIVRLGNIAAIPSERVKTKLGSMEALLVEIRSIGGLSGSPVIGRLDHAEPSIVGLIHGHFDQEDGETIDANSSGFGSAKINAGIAIVVPAQAIRETLAPLIEADFGEMRSETPPVT